MSKKNKAEYELVKSINKELNIMSKSQYISKKLLHKNYISDPHIYFFIKKVWIDWCDFLNIDRMKYIQTLNEWIDFCKSINVKSLDDYKENCKIYNQLPQDPELIYNDFTNINFELELNKNRRK